MNGEFIAYTLELAWKDNQKRISCIPVGVYKVTRRGAEQSASYKYDHLHVLDVPNRSYILFHVANYPKDIKGCIGVGETRDLDFVGNSRKAFKTLMDKLEPYEDIQLTIRNI